MKEIKISGKSTYYLNTAPLIWNNPVFVLLYWIAHWVLEVSGIVLVVVYFV